MLDELLTAINQADIPASTRANAFALAACAHPDNGFVCLEWTEVAELFRLASVRSARRHLTAMKDAGLIHYSTNARVYVTFESFIARGRAEIARPRAEISHGAGLPATTLRLENAEIARGRAEIARPRAEIAREAAPPVGKDLTTGREEGKEDPSFLLPLEGSGEPQPPPTEQARSLALLLDPAVGFPPQFAPALAAKHSFQQILRQVLRAVRELNQPKPPIHTINVIKHRLETGAAASILAADRQTALWDRHCGLDDDLRSFAAHVPAGYEDIIEAGMTPDQLARLKAWRAANGEENEEDRRRRKFVAEAAALADRRRKYTLEDP